MGFDGCRLKVMGGELKRAELPAKMANESQSLRGVARLSFWLVACDFIMEF